MRTLEEITYEAGRSALADQESLVAGVRQRIGTLLAPWRLKSAVAHAVRRSVRPASAEAPQDTLGWLATAAHSQALRERMKVRRMPWLSGPYGILWSCRSWPD